MRAGLLGLLIVPLVLSAGDAAAQSKAVTGTVCSGPTPFHCAVFGAGFTQFHESFRGRVRPDMDVAAEFCASRSSARVLSARRRPWPGGRGNEVFVVDVTCGSSAAVEARSAPRALSEAATEIDEPLPRIRGRAPSRADRSPERARGAGRGARTADAVERGRPARRSDPRPALAETPKPSVRSDTAETERPPEPVRPPETVREAVRAPVEPKPAAEPKPEADASPPAARPAGESGSSARRKRYEESLTYEHF